MIAEGFSDAGLQDLGIFHLCAAEMKLMQLLGTYAVAGDSDALLHFTQAPLKEWLDQSSAGPMQEQIAAAENPLGPSSVIST